MKRLIYFILKKTGIALLINYIYDAYRFARSKNSFSEVTRMDAEQSKMHLLRLAHSLEKGLSLPAPSPGFGKDKAHHLKKEADAYFDRFGSDKLHKLVLSTLAAHQRWQDSVGGESPGFSVPDLEFQSANTVAGARTVSRQFIWSHAKIDFDAFALNRHSIRDFTGEFVSEGDVIEAIQIAIKSPSVCNRSCARAYYSNDPRTIRKVLAFQNGNRGFGHKAGAVIVIAADMRAFYKNGERNQGWIDGALFAMSLNYALHARGYGVCMLNWSMDAHHDYLFRKSMKIPKEHLVVMLMAVGHIPESLQVAESPRRDVSDFAFKIAI